MPKVSVILSSYNHAPYIAEAIGSVLNQTFQDYELLIYDDGSTDGSADIIRSFHDDRIKTFLYEENRGPSEASKEAFSSAKGKYIAIHHSDDVWELDKLEKQVDFLDGHLEYAACFSYASFIDEESRIHELEEGDFYKTVFQQPNRTGVEWLNYFFDHPNCLCHPSMLIRREMYEKHQMIPPEGMRQIPDFYMWLRLFAGGEEIYILAESLVRFRLRNNTKSENVSGESLENTLRRNYEYIHIAQIYASLSAKQFCQIFPDFEKYVVAEDTCFALGKKFLQSDIPIYRFYGLKLLDSVLNDSEKEIVRDKMQYGRKDFWIDAGNTDCFGLLNNMHVAHMTVFYDCGTGYQEHQLARKECYIQGNGHFFACFELRVPDGTKKLRFDPEEGHMVRVRLNSFAVNGKELDWYNNGIQEDDGYFFFYDGDPIYETQGEFSDDLEIVISGEMKYIDGIDFVSEIVRQKETIKSQLDETQHQLDETQHQFKETKYQLESRNQRLEMAEMELQMMRNSTSWRYTKPLRQISRIMREWKK